MKIKNLSLLLFFAATLSSQIFCSSPERGRKSAFLTAAIDEFAEEKRDRRKRYRDGINEIVLLREGPERTRLFEEMRKLEEIAQIAAIPQGDRTYVFRALGAKLGERSLTVTPSITGPGASPFDTERSSGASSVSVKLRDLSPRDPHLEALDEDGYYGYDSEVDSNLDYSSDDEDEEDVHSYESDDLDFKKEASVLSSGALPAEEERAASETKGLVIVKTNTKNMCTLL